MQLTQCFRKRIASNAAFDSKTFQSTASACSAHGVTHWPANDAIGKRFSGWKCSWKERTLFLNAGNLNLKFMICSDWGFRLRGASDGRALKSDRQSNNASAWYQGRWRSFAVSWNFQVESELLSERFVMATVVPNWATCIPTDSVSFSLWMPSPSRRHLSSLARQTLAEFLFARRSANERSTSSHSSIGSLEACQRSKRQSKLHWLAYPTSKSVRLGSEKCVLLNKKPIDFDRVTDFVSI